MAESVARLPLEVEKVLAVSLAVEKTSLEDVQPENIEEIPFGITERVFALPLAIEKESLEGRETENVEEVSLGDRGTGNVEKAPLETVWRGWDCKGLPQSY
jgi:hypothetical protein